MSDEWRGDPPDVSMDHTPREWRLRRELTEQLGAEYHATFKGGVDEDDPDGTLEGVLSCADLYIEALEVELDPLLPVIAEVARQETAAGGYCKSVYKVLLDHKGDWLHWPKYAGDMDAAQWTELAALAIIEAMRLKAGGAT
jgi:hypothetical protein